MADRIKARVGDLVETSFSLKLKKAEVARLPNQAKYAAFNFFMLCAADNKFIAGAGAGSSASPIRCATLEVTRDDQPVTAQFHFASPAMGPDFFRAGDLWKLYFGYCAKDEPGPTDPKDPDVHLLAEVELTAPA